MPGSRNRHRSHTRIVRPIDGSCTTSIDKWKDPECRNFVVVKFSVIKTLRQGETGFLLQGSSPNLGNWRGALKTVECPVSSGHHVVYAALPKNNTISYKWQLLDTDGRTVKEKEAQRTIQLEEKDLTVQDFYGVYASVLPQVFQPDYHVADQVLIPVAFVTSHKVDNSNREAVAIIGSTPQLGRWRAINSKMMYEIEPNTWATILYLSKGLRFKYKFVVIDKVKSKRIKYGERRDHKVNLLAHDEDGDSSSVAQRGEKPEIHGIWTPTTHSNISIEHLEAQSMGSVASEISLGTEGSVASYLSDIGEDVDEAELAQAEELAPLEEQNNLLDELKEELYGSMDLIDFHANKAESRPLIEEILDSNDEDANLVNTANMEGNACICGSEVLPLSKANNDQLCAQWLMQQDSGRSKEDVSEENDQHDITIQTTISTKLDKSTDVDNLIVNMGGQVEKGTDSLMVSSNGVSDVSTKISQIETVLKTSTNQLPCYFTGELDALVVARKVVSKLPWVLELPTGLVKRVLHSLGILSGDKQTEICEQFHKVKEEQASDREGDLSRQAKL